MADAPKHTPGRIHCAYCGAPERRVQEPVCCVASYKAAAAPWERLAEQRARDAIAKAEGRS